MAWNHPVRAAVVIGDSQRFVAAEVPEKQRPFFGLRFLERCTQVEIAERLGIPRSTLEGWEHALVDKLRTFILERGP